MHPNASGYDEFFGFINGASNYRPDGQFGTKINQEWNPILRNRVPVEETEYLTDAFGREAVSFIDRHHEKPFLLYVPFNAIHGPMQATDADMERFKHIKDRKRRLAVAMAYNLDVNIGRIMDALRRHNLEEDTLVFFLSDNGGNPKGNGSLNTPLRGTKGQLWDGGIRIPFCMQWPARIEGAQTVADPVISLDILPTVVAAAGGEVEDAIDGVNLLPRLTGKAAKLPTRCLYWRFNRGWAIRDAEWKLISANGGSPKLFHISEDIGESRPLNGKYPETAARLQKAYGKWNETLMPKLWGWDSSFPVHDPGMGGH